MEIYRQFPFYNCHKLNSQSQAAILAVWCIILRRKLVCRLYYPPALASVSSLLYLLLTPANQYLCTGRVMLAVAIFMLHMLIFTYFFLFCFNSNHNSPSDPLPIPTSPQPPHLLRSPPPVHLSSQLRAPTRSQHCLAK